MKYFALYVCVLISPTVFSLDWESTYAEKNPVLCRVDFPQKRNHRLLIDRSKENSVLAEKYNPKGHFSFVVLLDKQERVLGGTGYHKISAEAYVSLLNSFIK